MGKIRSAPRDALVADISTDQNRGKHFGLLRAMDNLGAVAGILICLVLINLISIRLLFALAALPSLTGAMLILTRIKEDKPSDKKIFKGLSFRDLSPNLRLYMFLSAIFALGAFSYSFLLIHAKNLGFKTGLVPVLYLIFTAAASLFSYPFGRLSDKLGRKPVLMIAFLCWAGVSLGIIFSRNLVVIILLFVLYGVHKAALDPVQKTLVCELSPLQFRASCLGGFQLVIGLCALPSSLLAGLLWEKWGSFAPFYLSLGLTAIAFILLIFVRERQ
jgi:MFS family permease